MDDRTHYVRTEAIQAVQVLAGKEAVPELVALLQDEESSIRYTAIACLQRARATEAVGELRDCLRDGDAYVRRSAMRALVSLRDRGAIPDLVRLLQDRDRNGMVPREAAQALADLQAREASSQILPLLRVEHTRLAALEALGGTAGKEQIPEILALLSDQDESTRAEALDALGRLEAKEHTTRILDALRDRSPRVRWMAVEILGRWGVRDAVPQIAELLSDTDRHVPAIAAASLCLLGSRQGLETLLKRGEKLWPANALRQPEIWERLGKARLSEDIEGPPERLLERLAKLAGLGLDLGRTTWGDDEALFPRDERIDCRAGRRTLLEAFEEVIHYRYEIILEADRVLLVPRNDAVAFWRAWSREK
jgi:HEAT repeat protein